MSEEGVIRALDRHFPGSEWLRDEPSRSVASARPTDAPSELRAPSASAPSEALAQDGSSPALPGEGTGPVSQIAFIGAGTLPKDPKPLVQWAKGQVDRGIPILVGPGRWAKKAQTPMDTDARLIEIGKTLGLPVFICPPQEPWFEDAVTYEILDTATEVVIAGAGGKPNLAKKWFSNSSFRSRAEIPLIEI